MPTHLLSIPSMQGMTVMDIMIIKHVIDFTMFISMWMYISNKERQDFRYMYMYRHMTNLFGVGA